MGSEFDGLEDYGVNVDVGIEYTGNRDKYIAAIERYCNSYESNCLRITETLSARKIDDYTIAVHALKSNSRMIGAGGLGSVFEALELAARAGNISVLVNDTQDALGIYETLVERLKELVKDKGASAADEIDIQTARGIITELLEALDEYDDEGSAALAARLSGYPFDDKGRELLDKISGFIGEFLYDEAAELVREIEKIIK